MIDDKQKIILRAEDGTKLYPRSLSTEIIKEDGSTFNPQEKLTVGQGVTLDESTNTLASNITINEQFPEPVTIEGTTIYNFDLDKGTGKIIDSEPTQDSENLVTSGGVYNYISIRYKFYVTLMKNGTKQGDIDTLISNLFGTAYDYTGRAGKKGEIYRYYFYAASTSIDIGQYYEPEIFGMGHTGVLNTEYYRPILYKGERDASTGMLILNPIADWVASQNYVAFYIEVIEIQKTYSNKGE